MSDLSLQISLIIVFVSLMVFLMFSKFGNGNPWMTFGGLVVALVFGRVEKWLRADGDSDSRVILFVAAILLSLAIAYIAFISTKRMRGLPGVDTGRDEAPCRHDR